MRSAIANALVPDPTLIALVAQAHQWLDALAKGQIGSVRDIGKRDRVDPSDVGRILQLAFLAPDIVEAILAGRQPIELTSKRLKRIGSLPLHWQEQRRMLGFPG
jgi:site-specific DNA recombinase